MTTSGVTGDHRAVGAVATTCVCGAVLALGLAAVPDQPRPFVGALAAVVLVTGLLGVTTGARRVGPTLARLQHRALDPFAFFALVVVAVVADVVAVDVVGARAETAGAGALGIVGVLYTAGVAGVLRERFREHASELLREALFVMTFVGVTAWLGWIEGPWQEGRIQLLPALLGIGAAWSAGVALFLSVRLALSFRGPIRWLVVPAGLLVTAAVVDLAGELGGPGWSGSPLGVAAELGTAGFLGAALGLPRIGPVRTSVVIPPTRAGVIRLATVFAAVLLVPAITLARLLSDIDIVVGSLAGSTAVLSVAAVAYLGGLARDWGALERRARHDELTGLHNRRSFTERIAVACAEAAAQDTAPAVMFCDLDRFKVVNDSLGHEAGNQLLIAVATRLAEALPPDAVPARLGGDEFAVLLLDADDSEAVAVARAVLAQLTNPIDVLGRSVHVGASIGVARYPVDGTDPDALLRAADTAMYRAKDLGRARVVLHNEALRTEVEGRFALETDLHKAVDEGQLRLVYQPRVDLLTGDVVGAEALLRWEHPLLGAVPPSRFIPVAEETGLIRKIGVHALTMACRQLAAWEKAGYPQLLVSVNFSARQFELDRVADIVAQVLRETEADPRWLELELTESLAHHDIDEVSATLADLAGMGVRCSIDDFGTGYSGLSYLGRFSLHALKIDKGFVQAIDAPRAAGTVGEPESVVSAVIALARSFGLRVIAEGVETLAQLRFLIENGCDELQGHLFSPPIEVDAFESLLMLERVATGPGRLEVLRTRLADADADAPRVASNVIHLGGRRLRIS